MYHNQMIDITRIATVLNLDTQQILKPGGFLIYEDSKAEVAGRWILDFHGVNKHLQVLDREIARRNKLIGVMG